MNKNTSSAVNEYSTSAFLPDDSGHDLCSEENAKGGSSLRGEEAHDGENGDGVLTEI